MRSKEVLVFMLLAALCAASAGAFRAPVAVSPGDASKLARIADRCPTFSWGSVPGADAYELVVYRLGGEGAAAEPVLQRSFHGSVDGWTPSLDDCLERGGRYAWSVRAVGREEASDWSAPSLFEVARGPSEMELEQALRVMRRYLVTDESSSSGVSEVESSSPGDSVMPGAGPAEEAGSAPSSRSVASGDSALQVNGSPVVTVATFAGALCSTTEVRFLDLGDGTVLDCNTGNQWLKDADCIPSAPWVDDCEPPCIPETIFTRISLLNSGFDYDCEDYVPGSYSNWRVPEITEMCSAWMGPSLSPCPAGAASDSLIDSGYSSPAVTNAYGDGQWMQENAFVDVQTVNYWSNTPFTAISAFFANFDLGNVAPAARSNVYRVWPVRSGQ